MPPPYLDFLDTSYLPQGLPEQAYATWCLALRDFCNCQTVIEVEHVYQFFRGFVQALQDTQAVQSGVCLFLESQAREIWIERVTALQAQGK